MYYTMGEVSAMFDVNQSLLRFYEKEFDILQPKKNKKGNRYFTPEDIENLKIIFHLIRDKGYTINGAREHLKKNMESLITWNPILGYSEEELEIPVVQRHFLLTKR